MKFCDFSSVTEIINNFFCTDCKPNQLDLMYMLFDSFMHDDASSDFDFDNGLVCRWINGQAKISSCISSYYMDKDFILAADINKNILPIMYDSSAATNEIYNLVIHDNTISPNQKQKLIQDYLHNSAHFIADVLIFTMERTFRKRTSDLKSMLTTGNFSPIVYDFIFGCDVPKPCRYFCGRQNELDILHNLICENGKVFIYGIAGIGKSELAKAYAKSHKKDYTNIIYITYSGNLKDDICNMDFNEDLPEDNYDDKFNRHNRFLKTLKEDTLIIIDNFNVTADADILLPILMQYRCHVIITTRSVFENYTSLHLEEISEKYLLLELMAKFYSDAEEYSSVLEEIIDEVHSHTLAVELSAKLLENGIAEPCCLLKKLKEQKTSLDSSDNIEVIKDGKHLNATYYTHIHTLFSMYNLSSEELDIMRNLVLISTADISRKLFANWLELDDMNNINSLIEKGFIQSENNHHITLHPMIQEIALDETRPSVKRCNTMLLHLQKICLQHGIEIPYHRQLFKVIENIVNLIFIDNTEFYLHFLEDVFPYMQKYDYEKGCKIIIGELSAILSDNSVGEISDRALLFDYHSAFAETIEESIDFEERAISSIKTITEDTALLASNLYANAGALYKQLNNTDKARKYMEKGIKILNDFNMINYHDSIMQMNNYAVLMADIGHPSDAISVLHRLSEIIAEHNSDQCIDYAEVHETIGAIYSSVGNIKSAIHHFKIAITIYEEQLKNEPDILDFKRSEIIQACSYIGTDIKSLIEE